MDDFSPLARTVLLAFVGIVLGFAYGAVLSLVALAGYAIPGPELFEALGVTLRGTLMAYFAGGMLAGAAAGVLGYHVRSQSGAIIVGTIAAVPLMASVFVALEGWPPDLWNWGGVTFLSVVFGFFCGRAVWDEHQTTQGRRGV